MKQVQDTSAVHQIFSMFHPEWYESIDRYQPSEELLRVVRPLMPDSWVLRRSSKWFHISPQNNMLPRQGWKLHISATPTQCEAILQAVATICITRGTAFKFSLDRFFTTVTTSKRWPREASGKFITIYPLHEDDFRELAEILYVRLQGFDGPYILSDKRYKDSHVVYYRYGGIDQIRQLSYRGYEDMMLTAPDGELVPDVRGPFWYLQPWVANPFESNTPSDETSDAVL